MKYHHKYSRLLSSIWLILFTICPSSKAAEQVAFVSGAFKRTVSVENIEHLARTGEAKDLLKDFVRFSNEDPKKIATLLNESVELPLVLTSKLMYSSIGEVILRRVAKIIYPVKVPDRSVSVPAIRSAVIKGLLAKDENLNLIDFLKAYPNKIIAINVPALTKVINKVETMTDLVKFFSNSPLEGLKERKL